MAKRGAVKPPKPYSSFPMFAHRNGSWTKTVNRRHERFGRWRWPDLREYEASWQAALLAFRKFEEATARGEEQKADPRLIDIRTICNGYLTQQRKKADAGKIRQRTFAEQRKTIKGFCDAVGGDTTVGHLEQEPRSIRDYVEDLEGRLGFHRYNNSIQQLRSMWRWASDPDNGMLGDVPFKRSKLFTKRAIREFRRQRRLEREQGKVRSFTPDEVQALIDLSYEPLRTMILLGYFCTYGNTDLGEAPDSILTVYAADERIYLHGHHEVIPAGWGTLYFPRPKTELDRWAIVPPLVVKAVQDAIARRPKPKLAIDRNKLFLTREGRRVCYDIERRDGNGIVEKVIGIDNVAQLFKRQLARVGHCPAHGWQNRKPFTRNTDEHGKKVHVCPVCEEAMVPMKRRGFYALRHTSTTRAAGSGASSDTRSLFEGHASESSVRQTYYLDPTQLHDLYLIGRHLAALVGLSKSGPEVPVTADAPTAA